MTGFTDGLRVVLFGLPAAGKSSLLGALGQSSQTQEHLLGGQLLDLSQALVELGRQVYDEPVPRTVEEVVPYPVRYEPHPPERSGPLEAILLDCDGRVANDILAHQETLEQHSSAGTLAREIRDAHALLLVVDASASPARIEADFSEFTRFLDAMQQSRGRRAEVAGLPVFLVLTKCDLLAQPGDSTADWMERIEQRKREVGERFRNFLAGPLPPLPTGTASPPLSGTLTDTPFGRLELHVWATAIKRPPLAQTPARPREPYGVAELFRQALEEASGYRRRYQRSQRRLGWLVAATGMLVVLMATLTLGLVVLNLNTRLNALRNRVTDLRSFDPGTPGERLRGTPGQLRERQQILEEIRGNEQFLRLSGDDRAFIDERLQELKEYLPYLVQILGTRPLPGIQSEENLDTLLRRLQDELALPHDDWADTPAGQLRRDKLESAQSLRRAVQAARNWYLDSSDQAGRLWTLADYGTRDIDWAEWAVRVERLVDPGRRPPFRANEPVPGVTAGPVTYSHVLAYNRVLEARAVWETERARLERVLNIACALGLAPPTQARPAVLVLPRDLTLAGCQARLTELREAYPGYEKTFVRTGLPEAALPAVRRTARRHYEVLLGPGQAEVLRHLQKAGNGSQETTARWESVRRWLAQPEELTAWRELAGVLLRLDNPSTADPVQALAAFLGQKEFTVEVRSILLEVPELRGLAPRAESRLVVLHPASKRQPALAFEPVGEPVRDSTRQVRIHTFRLAEGQRLAYTPGDKLWAELPLRGGKERLVWSQSRSTLYQFERLINPPRLQDAAAASLDEGRLLHDVRLVPRPPEGVPVVPDLLPQVRLE